MSTLRKHNIRGYEHGARRVTSQDFYDFDYILAMDRWNLKDLEKMQRRAIREKGQKEKKAKAKVMMFGAFGRDPDLMDKDGIWGDEEVVDPYYGADDGFEVVYRQCVRFTEGFFKEVLEKRDAKQET